MNDAWQEMDTAPKDVPVLICSTDCEILVAVQKEGEVYLAGGTTQKRVKGWVWQPHLQYSQYTIQLKPRMWQPVPMPPKHLYERKLTADLLEKQIKELRNDER